MTTHFRNRPRPLNTQGAHHILLPLLFLVLAAIGFVGFNVYKKTSADTALLNGPVAVDETSAALVGEPAKQVTKLTIEKALGKAASEGGAAATALELLVGGDEQQSLPPENFSVRIRVLGVSTTGNSNVALKGAKVKFASVNRDKGGGCGLGKPKVGRATVNGKGEALIANCTPGEYDIELRNIPKPWSYKKLNPEKSLRVYMSNSAAEQGKIARGELGMLEVDVVLRNPEYASPKRLPPDMDIVDLEADQQQRAALEEAQCTATKNKEKSRVQGRYGQYGGNKIIYTGAATTPGRTVKITNLLGKQGQLDMKGASDRCKESVKYARTYRVHVFQKTYPHPGAPRPLYDSVVALRFHGAGGCKVPNLSRTPRGYASNGQITFNNCTRNQIDLELTQLPKYYQIVDRPDNRKGVVEVRSSGPGQGGDAVDLYITFQNELEPWTNAERARFNRATYRYWAPRANQTKQNINNASCQPHDVRYRYHNQTVKKDFDFRQGAVAAASGIMEAFSPPNPATCYIKWNTSASRMGITTNREFSCLIAVHEYGHMLGWQHKDRKKHPLMHPIPWNVDERTKRETGC